MIILLALCLTGNQYPDYRYAIIAGLIFSLAGDIFLMLPDDRFISGLVSFLMAHLAYIYAFTSGVGVGITAYIAFPVLIIGGIMYRYLSPGLGRMKLPVLIYMVVILVMVWVAWERWDVMGENYRLSAPIGASSFVVSDALLAINRFRKPFNSARGWILFSYMIAQLLIALSV